MAMVTPVIGAVPAAAAVPAESCGTAWSVVPSPNAGSVSDDGFPVFPGYPSPLFGKAFHALPPSRYA